MTTSVSTTSSSRRRLIILYASAVFLYWASLYLYVPTLSVYVESKAPNLALVGTVLSMYGLWQAVARFPLGLIADWVGRRKPFILGGFALAAAGALLMGTARGVPGLLVGRALTGFAASAWVLLVVAFSSLFPPEDAVRASATLSAVNAVARVLATSLNGPLNAWGGYSLAFYAGTVTAVVAILVLLLARESPREPQAPSLADVGKLITRPDVLLPSLLCAVLQYAVWSSTFGFTTNLARDLGAPDTLLSLLVTMNIGLVMLGNLFAGALSKRLGAHRLLLLTFVLVAAGLGTLAASQALWSVFVGQVCMGLASGVGYPVMMGRSIRDVDDEQRASAMGLFQAVYAIGMFSGPWLSGILADATGIRPMFALIGVACTALGIAGAFWLRRYRIPD